MTRLQGTLKQPQQIPILVHFLRLCLCQRLFFHFLTTSLFQESTILICSQFLFWKKICFWFCLVKFLNWPDFIYLCMNICLDPIQYGEGRVGGDKNDPLPYQFFPCNFYKLKNQPQNFLTFNSFLNPFSTLVQNLKPIPSASTNFWTWAKGSP